MTLQTDLQALETDAQTWDDVSSTLSTAAPKATDLSLTVGELSWAADVTGLATTYQTYVDFVAARLGEGADETATIAAGLRQVKAAFEGAEGSNINQFDGLWDAVSE